MSDEIPTTELTAIACFRHGNGYAVALMDRDGDLKAYHLSEAKVRQVFMVIGEALQPGLLASLGFNMAP